MTDERKLLLLGLLRQTDMHGYMLNEHLDGVAPVSLKKPTAYNLLDRMEKDGWIVGHDESTGDRPRKVYSVTEEGDAAFFRLLREQVPAYAPNESPAMVSIGFLDALEADEARELLERRRDAARVHRAALVSQSDDAHGHAGTGFLPVEYARRLAELDLAFLDEVITEFERNEGEG